MEFTTDSDSLEIIVANIVVKMSIKKTESKLFLLNMNSDIKLSEYCLVTFLPPATQQTKSSNLFHNADPSETAKYNH